MAYLELGIMFLPPNLKKLFNKGKTYSKKIFKKHVHKLFLNLSSRIKKG